MQKNPDVDLIFFRITFFFFISLISLQINAEPAKFLLAKKADQNIDIHAYWVSEKLDGVRAWWDGERLISRGGYGISAPDWFIENFPEETMDGELWLARGQFDLTSSIVRQVVPDERWHQIKYMIFDLPDAEMKFDDRVERMKSLIARAQIPHLKMIKQYHLKTIEILYKKLDDITKKGAEGLMLHRGDSYYRGGRSGDLLKLKKFDDAEATVIDHLPGKGKYSGMLGSLKVRTKQGIIFRVGSGLTDQLRKSPPPVGTTITYRYSGLTKNGKPRFPVFIRVRDRQLQ